MLMSSKFFFFLCVCLTLSCVLVCVVAKEFPSQHIPDLNPAVGNPVFFSSKRQDQKTFTSQFDESKIPFNKKKSIFDSNKPFIIKKLRPF